MHTVQVLNQVVEHNLLLAYLLIFLFTIIEGEIVGISSGILILLGILNFWVALVAVFLGGIMKTFLGYYIGAFLRKKFDQSKFLTYMEKKVFYVMPRFNQNKFWSIFVSKFIVGFNHLVILFCGYRKVNFKTYMKAELLSTSLWAPLMLFLGYFFSYAALQVSRHISEFLLIVVLFTIGFFLLDKLISSVYNMFEHI